MATTTVLVPDLFEFAYVPNCYGKLDDLAAMALEEPWRFKNPVYLAKNEWTPILERYIHTIFKKQGIDFNYEKDPDTAGRYFYVRNEVAASTPAFTQTDISLFTHALTETNG